MPTFIKPGFWEKAKKGYKDWLNLDLLIESKIPVTPTPTLPYKVYTALLTQSGGSVPKGFNNGGDPLTIGMTYQIIENGGSGWDFTNIGAPNNDLGTYFVATGLIPNSWGIDGQLESNLGAPVVTVLENTIGNIWFTYNTIGSYFVNSNGLFTLNKTWNIRTIELGIGGSSSKGAMAYGEDGNSFGIGTESTYDTASDNILANIPIEIRVYN